MKNGIFDYLNHFIRKKSDESYVLDIVVLNINIKLILVSHGIYTEICKNIYIYIRHPIKSLDESLVVMQTIFFIFVVAGSIRPTNNYFSFKLIMIIIG